MHVHYEIDHPLRTLCTFAFETVSSRQGKDSDYEKPEKRSGCVDVKQHQ